MAINRGPVAVLIALALCAAVAMVHRRNEQRSGSDPIIGTVRDIAVIPAQTFSARAGRWLHMGIGATFSGPRLARENAALRARVTALTVRNAELAAADAENARLRALLDFQARSPRRLLAAEVAALKPSATGDTLVLARGGADGVKLHAVVVSPNGDLVGQVIVVSKHSSTVLMLTDVASSVGSEVDAGGKAAAVGICRGAGAGQAFLTYLKIDSRVTPGESVCTSGLGSTYPPGIPIGVVSTVKPNPAASMKAATVRPLADLDHLDAVFIVMRE